MCINVTYINYYRSTNKLTRVSAFFLLVLSPVSVYVSVGFFWYVPARIAYVYRCVNLFHFQNAEYTYVYIDSLRSPLLKPVIVDVCCCYFFFRFDRLMNSMKNICVYVRYVQKIQSQTELFEQMWGQISYHNFKLVHLPEFQY